MPAPIGHLIDSLGIEASLEDTDMVSDAVVLLHVTKADGTPVVKTLSSANIPWLTRRGMLEVAAQAERGA